MIIWGFWAEESTLRNLLEIGHLPLKVVPHVEEEFESQVQV